MSHVVQMATEVRREDIVQRVCARLNLPAPSIGETTLFDGTKCNGISVQLPGWRYPVVFDLEDGRARYDNYGGSWGKQEQLDGFLQAYPIEAAKQTAEIYGHPYQERTLENGDLELVVETY